MKRFIVIMAVFVVCGIAAGGIFCMSADIERPAAQLAEANNKFAFDIFQKIQKEDAGKNIFISPYSIATALAMLYNGASGEGRAEMAVVLGYEGMELTDLNARQLELKKLLEGAGEKVTINVANSLWAREGIRAKKSFNDALSRYYDSELFTRDFADKRTVGEINGWISDRTEGMIPAMLQDISPECIMFLINAIYFKGIWTDEFDVSMTEKAMFTDYKGKETQVEMMRQKRHFLYGETKDYKALRLPYGDGEAAMYIILPHRGEDIDEVMARFDNNEWSHLLKNIAPHETEVAIPKFRMEYGVKRLNGALEMLGMKRIFQAGYLLNILDDPRLFVEYVDHKAVIEVDERGTEAAAVTIISLGKSAYVRPKYFIADRPFFFVIRDERSGVILFIGKLLYP